MYIERQIVGDLAFFPGKNSQPDHEPRKRDDMQHHWQQWKYLAAYAIPLSALVGLSLGGAWSYATVWLAFVVIPILETVLGGRGGNVPPEDESRVAANRVYDGMLYLNLPLLWAIVGLFAYQWVTPGQTTGELIGMTLSAGIAAGACGINVAHELGHREDPFHQWLARLLLLPELYQHFTIEHNYGHHKYVATPRDPATARPHETVYRFWWRSITGSYRSAWDIEKRRLEREGEAFYSTSNKMLLFAAMSVGYLVVMGLIFGWQVITGLLAVALVAVLLLETINYVEHYGLRRRLLADGRYETTTVAHSWNSNHDLGRIMLYELTRHADHHEKTNRKYPILRHIESSPQLPYGYPTSILLALVPPLWFYVMDPRLPERSQLETA